jgi:DNA-binding Xre family transcriptional regulator
VTARLDYRWNLRAVMADRGMFSTAALRPLLAERGVTLSPTQVWRLVTEKPERLNLRVLVALTDILGCRMEELIEPVAATAPRRRRAAGEQPAGSAADGGEGGVGAFRPRRARIVPDGK